MSATRAVFTGFDSNVNFGNFDTGLWVTDGTTSGTSELASWFPNTSGPFDLTAFGSEVLFSADIAVGTPLGLWVTDGTSAGTSALNVVGGGGQPLDLVTDLTVVGNKVLFNGQSSQAGQVKFGLWVTDGTAAGTSELNVPGEPPGGANPSDITPFGTRALFAGGNALAVGPADLWITDGTAAGTSDITPSSPGAESLSPTDITVFGGRALFAGNDPRPSQLGKKFLWVTDGTTGGTSELSVAQASPFGLNPTNLTALGGKVLFDGKGPSNSVFPDLFVSDGTSAGTSELSVTGASVNGLDAQYLTVLGSKVIFEGNVHELWVTDGTSAGTSEINVPGLMFGSLPPDFTVFQNEVLFRAPDLLNFGTAIWATDGTVAGTSEINTLTPLAGFQDLTAMGNQALFNGTALVVHGSPAGLWATDGTAAGTAAVNVIGASPSGLNPMNITAFAALCFHHGTRIASPTGETPVQDLRAGDLVLTAGGAAVPVRWISERRLDLTRHPDPAAASPIRIRRGALAHDVPRRDLLVSPDHAMFLDGLLIPARLLANGATILRETDLPAVHYFHVELDTHGILIAEGALSESYLDTGNRGTFDNADVPLTLHPDFLSTDGQAIRERNSCAPLAADAARVRPVWDRLAERAEALGHVLPALATTDQPDLRIAVDGREIRPVSIKGDEYVFALPRGRGEAHLLSRAAAPCDAAPWVEDRRRLGVMVRRITLEAGGDVRTIAPDEPSFVDGWWEVEGDAGGPWRWTAGDAVLPLRGMTDPVLLRVVCRPGAYPTAIGTGRLQALRVA